MAVALALPGRHFLVMFGRSLRLWIGTFRPSILRKVQGGELRQYFTYMGLDAAGIIIVSAVLVSLPLTTQAVLELKRFGADAAAGALIAVGLLRELGMLTAGMVWATKMSAFLSEDTLSRLKEADVTSEFVATRYIAAVLSAWPLSIIGMVVGFAAGAYFAQLLGVSSWSDFVESGRQAVQPKDVVVYFVKMVLVNPTVVVLTSIAVATEHRAMPERAAAQAVGASCVSVFVVNLLITLAMYLP